MGRVLQQVGDVARARGRHRGGDVEIGDPVEGAVLRQQAGDGLGGVVDAALVEVEEGDGQVPPGGRREDVVEIGPHRRAVEVADVAGEQLEEDAVAGDRVQDLVDQGGDGGQRMAAPAAAEEGDRTPLGLGQGVGPLDVARQLRDAVAEAEDADHRGSDRGRDRPGSSRAPPRRGDGSQSITIG
ncbi:hypothetical protein [Methylobacterium mesophilicum]|uniref:hypothetical protein n=1 Tax=Methylobacterium mesophilicum TaxID=39956 RepID=UPI002F35F7EC